MFSFFKSHNRVFDNIERANQRYRRFQELDAAIEKTLKEEKVTLCAFNDIEEELEALKRKVLTQNNDQK